MQTAPRLTTAIATALACLALPNAAGAATFTVTNANDSGAGSLRAAITDANNTFGADEIVFDIAGDGPHRIDLAEEMPPLIEEVTVDGCSQAGADCESWPPTLMVELNGADLPDSRAGFRLVGMDILVRGFAIMDFPDQSTLGVVVAGERNTIQTNYIGTDAANSQVYSTNVGVAVTGTNNLIGTDGDGDNDVAEGNLVVGSRYTSIDLTGNGNRVSGNVVGLAADGQSAMGNRFGIIVRGSRDNIIGTNGDGSPGDADEGNISAGNDIQNIYVEWSGGSWIAGNTVGLNRQQTMTFGPGTGIEIWLNSDDDGGTRIGTNGDGVSDAFERNVIGGHGGAGIVIRGDNIDPTEAIVIAGNTIGVNDAGEPFPNGAGVSVGDVGNVIVGADPETGDPEVEGNLIAGNDVGVRTGALGDPAAQIYGNDTSGNTNADVAPGGNVNPSDNNGDNIQNSPTLTDVVDGTVTGTITEQAGLEVRVDLYANAAFHPSGRGGGEVLVGSTTVTIANDNEASFSISYTPVEGKPFLTALASSATFGPSVFSRRVPAPTLNAPAGPLAAEEDTALAVTGVSGALEGATASTTVGARLSVTSGTLTLGAANSITFSEGDAQGAATLAFTGPFDQVNAALAGLTYTPDAEYSGADTLLVQFDSLTPFELGGGTAEAELAVEVAAVDDPPVLSDDAYATDEDTPLTVEAADGVLANDVDVDATEALVATLGDDVDGGTLELAADGSFTYTPAADANGEVTFTYTVAGAEAPATVTLTVNAINDAPVAVDDEGSTVNAVALTLDVLSNDTDVDGDALSLTEVGDPDNGTATIDGGQISYTSEADFTGTDTFTYTVSDGTGTATATVTVEVTEVPNEAPTPADDSATTTIGVPVEISPLDNDTDPDGDTLAITEVGEPSNGDAASGMGGVVTYTPDPGFEGTDSFTYTVSDGTGATAMATITVVVSAVPNADPTPADDSATTAAGEPVDIDVLSNDTDPDGDTLAIIVVGEPGDGTAASGAGGVVTYTPDVGFEGTDSFTYTVSDGNGATAMATVTVTVEPPDEVDDDMDDMDDIFDEAEGDSSGSGTADDGCGCQTVQTRSTPWAPALLLALALGLVVAIRRR